MPLFLMANFGMNSLRKRNRTACSRECGSSLVEYVILVAFLSVAMIGVLSDVGDRTRLALCDASLKNPDLNEDGILDVEDAALFASFGQDMVSDWNCNGQTSMTELTTDPNLAWGPYGDRRRFFDDLPVRRNPSPLRQHHQALDGG